MTWRKPVGPDLRAEMIALLTDLPHRGETLWQYVDEDDRRRLDVLRERVVVLGNLAQFERHELRDMRQLSRRLAERGGDGGVASQS